MAISQHHDQHVEMPNCRAFLDCIDCRKRSLALDGNLSDEVLASQFYAMGWSIKPTLCPACRSKRDRLAQS